MKSVRCTRNEFRSVVACLAVATVAGVGANCLAGSSSGLSRTLPLVRTDGTFVGTSQGARLPKGTVTLAIKGATQSFTIDAYNLAGPYDKGLVVFLGDSPQITNAALWYVDMLSRTGTNNHWRLVLESASGAPPQLGVTNLTDLVGLTVFVATETNQAILRAIVTDLVPNPSLLSYRRRVPLILPNQPLSQKAKGSILVSYNGRTGASIVDITARNLNANNRYIENGTLSNCVANGILAVGGKAHWKSDTGRGDELFSHDLGTNGVEYASDLGVTTVLDEIGDGIIIRDCFGGLHLQGTIPGPK
jgi:hypothetical protein